jgi:hypothetical protein
MEIKYYRKLKSSNLEYEKYLVEIAQNHCPFLEPSRKENKMAHSHYIFQSRLPIQEMLSLAILHTELSKTDSLNNNLGYLTCENLLFDSSCDITQETWKWMFDWVHWFMKVLYTDSGWVFGKFWKGEKILDKNQKEIISPPVNLFSIRKGIHPEYSKKSNDLRFFELKSPELKKYFLDRDKSINLFTKLNLMDEHLNFNRNVYFSLPVLLERNILNEVVNYCIEFERDFLNLNISNKFFKQHHDRKNKE